jgi:HEAT repeat protein
MTNHRMSINIAVAGVLALICLAPKVARGQNGGCPTGMRVSDVSHTAPNNSAQTEAERVVEEMRGLDMRFSGITNSFGGISPEEQHKLDIHRRLRELGQDVLPALIGALSDPDVQMRRSASFMMAALAGAFWPESQRPDPRLDLRQARGSLIRATADADADVRGWAALGLGEVGPDAQTISALVKLLTDSEQGPRDGGCEALGRFAPAAKETLPALREALNDSSKVVRECAQRAIDKIQKE